MSVGILDEFNDSLVQTVVLVIFFLFGNVFLAYLETSSAVVVAGD